MYQHETLASAGGNNIPAVNQYKSQPSRCSESARCCELFNDACTHKNKRKTLKFPQLSLHSSYYSFSVFVVWSWIIINVLMGSGAIRAIDQRKSSLCYSYTSHCFCLEKTRTDGEKLWLYVQSFWHTVNECVTHGQTE